MEVLSKIGEFFFDDGRASEEERLRAYREYKENMRKESKTVLPTTPGISKSNVEVKIGKSKKGRATGTTKSGAPSSASTKTTNTHMLSLIHI